MWEEHSHAHKSSEACFILVFIGNYLLTFVLVSMSTLCVTQILIIQGKIIGMNNHFLYRGYYDTNHLSTSFNDITIFAASSMTSID